LLMLKDWSEESRYQKTNRKKIEIYSLILLLLISHII